MRSTEVPAKFDPHLLLNDKVLDNLLALEITHRPTAGYCDTVQTEVKPWMRTVLTDWMLDVSLDAIYFHLFFFFFC